MFHSLNRPQLLLGATEVNKKFKAKVCSCNNSPLYSPPILPTWQFKGRINMLVASAHCLQVFPNEVLLLKLKKNLFFAILCKSLHIVPSLFVIRRVWWENTGERTVTELQDNTHNLHVINDMKLQRNAKTFF